MGLIYTVDDIKQDERGDDHFQRCVQGGLLYILSETNEVRVSWNDRLTRPVLVVGAWHGMAWHAEPKDRLRK